MECILQTPTEIRRNVFTSQHRLKLSLEMNNLEARLKFKLENRLLHYFAISLVLKEEEATLIPKFAQVDPVAQLRSIQEELFIPQRNSTHT